MKKTTIIGLLAFGFSASYLYLKSREEGSDGIQGIEVNVNPERFIEGALAMSSITPKAKDNLRQIATRAIQRYYEHE